MTFITALVYLAGSLVCHQLPERSFHLSGIQLPVCARCTGLYLGGVLGMLALFVLPHRSVTFQKARIALVVGAVPTILSVTTARLGLWDPSNVVRAAFAAPLGFVVGAIVAAVLARRLR
jgi:uncharacterized membrane protein